MLKNKNRINGNGDKKVSAVSNQTTTVAQQMILIRDTMDQTYKLMSNLIAALVNKAEEKV